MNVLILGAGLVAGPIVEYLLEKTKHRITCADRVPSKAEELINGHPQGKAVAINVSDAAALESLIKECDLAVSLLPYTLHVTVAEHCLKHKKHLVTSSYVSEGMRALDARAQEAGVLLLNEIGLDPGIDHMSAMRIIHSVEKKGGRILSFKSYCGGLPAPEANNNPLGYKFSWSPRGVLMAGRNPASWLEDGQRVEVPGPELFNHHWPVEVPGIGTLEGYPNRDSFPYLTVYGLGSATTMQRGTLRYPGWCKFWYKMAALGWLKEDTRLDISGKTWKEIMRKMVPNKSGDLLADLCALWGVDAGSDEIRKVKWLGLLSDEKVPYGVSNNLDMLCAHLMKKLAYGDNERDMVVLYHDFRAEFPGRKERITSTLIDYGVPGGDSSMSRTVSLPAAIAVRKILDGEVKLRGVQIPIMPEIYAPVLRELETLGIRFQEESYPDKNTVIL